MKNRSNNCYGIAMPVKFVFCILLGISSLMSCKKEATQTDANTISTQSTENAIISTPVYGALISSGDMNEKMQVCTNLGVTYVRSSITLKDFTGKDGAVDAYIRNGYKLLLNINYDVVQTVNGKKQPVPFPTDMVQYKSLLQKVLDKYKPEIAVIENEQTTDQFHSGPIENYITELKTAVSVCHQYGIKVADGGLIAQVVNMVKSGFGSGDKYTETKKLIEAYKTIDLDYINIHTTAPYSNGDPNVFPSSDVINSATYLKATTGKDVICNEYNQDNQSASLMNGAVTAFKTGGYKYLIARSGQGGTKSEPLNTGTTLTTIGKAYRDAIK